MTFIEAAQAVLKQEGRPMHSREIADKAVDRGLLSHMGKTPVQTMSARLSAAVSKGNKKGLFVRVSPGVFALSEWSGGSVDEPAPSVSVAREETKPDLARQAPAVSDSAPGEPGQQRKKKRRRRKKRSPAEGEAKASIVPQPVPVVKSVLPPPAAKNQGEGLPPSAKTGPEQRSRTATRPSPATKPPLSESQNAKPDVKPIVKTERVVPDKKTELANQIEAFLRAQTRPVPIDAILEQLGQKKDNAVNLVEALLVADGLERESNGLRPRFVERRNGYTLAEREISDEILGLERQAADTRARLIKIAERQVLRKLRSVSMKTFVQVMVVHLQRSGFEAMIPVDRSFKDEFHMSVQDRRHAGRFRTAVVLRRDSADFSLQDRAVMDLRGALHHYDATSGMIVTTGTLSERARSEALVPNLAPVSLVDGEMLAAEMVRLGIGVRSRSVNLPAFDDKFFSMFEAQNRWQ